MTSPRAIKESEPTDALWRRSVRAAVNLLIQRLAQSGPTSQRPRNPDVGSMFFDTTLNKPVWAKSATVWVDATGASV